MGKIKVLIMFIKREIKDIVQVKIKHVVDI
jgi:hypothetical protein